MSPAAPLAASATLAWMRGHGDLLRALVAEETGGAADDAPGGDPAIRAHLRFMAAALEATASGDLADRVAGFAGDLPEWFAANADLYEDHLQSGVGAIALEEYLQFGVLPGADPSLDAGLERRVRIGGWIRLFLLGLELRLGPQADGLEGATLGWMGARQRELSRLILSLDVQAKRAARESAGEGVDFETQDAIGQASVVQGYVRQLVEALEATLAEHA